MKGILNQEKRQSFSQSRAKDSYQLYNSFKQNQLKSQKTNDSTQNLDQASQDNQKQQASPKRQNQLTAYRNKNIIPYQKVYLDTQSSQVNGLVFNQKPEFKNQDQKEISDSILSLKKGDITTKQFRNVLENKNITINTQLDKMIRQVEAGDSKIKYHQIGSEIFKNYNDPLNSARSQRHIEFPNPKQYTKKQSQSPNLKLSQKLELGEVVFGQQKQRKVDIINDNEQPRIVCGPQTLSATYIPVKGRNQNVSRANQLNSVIKSTLNQELAKETNAHDEYLSTIKHAKDIRDMQNSEFDIISGTKAFVPKVKVGATSTRYTMGKINYADKAHIYKKSEFAGAYTPNYGLSRKAVPSKAKNDTGSPIKYKPIQTSKISNQVQA